MKIKQKASLTVEASIVLPIFLFAAMSLLYFFQIFMVQEEIHNGLTELGLDYAKYSYVYKESNIELYFDKIEDKFMNQKDGLLGLELIDELLHPSMVKVSASNYIDKKFIDDSCVKNGFEGLNFSKSILLDKEDCIDIIVRYQISVPIKIFNLSDFSLIQRVRVRGWTGHNVPPRYQEENQDNNSEEDIVFITETGKVYHLYKECSYLKLNIKIVQGIPSDLRNDSGGKYYPCERCKPNGVNEKYYITSDGTRYHSTLECSSLKRNYQEVKLSEVKDRKLCKRCDK